MRQMEYSILTFHTYSFLGNLRDSGEKDSRLAEILLATFQQLLDGFDRYTRHQLRNAVRLIQRHTHTHIFYSYALSIS